MSVRSIAVSLADWCRRNAVAVVMVAVVIAALLAWFVVARISIDTDQSRLIDEDLPWRQTEMQLDVAFPHNVDTLVIVVNGPTPNLADAAAGRLAERLAARSDLFANVRRPDALAFFRRNGLLFLPVGEVQSIADRLVEAQPLIGALTADPSLRGLLGALDLAVEGVERGDAELADLEGPLAAVADTSESVLAGKPEPVAWQTLLTGREADAGALRRFIIAQPVLNYGELSPGEAPSAFVRDSARALGLTPDEGYRVRLTGSVALSDEEFATVGEGAEISSVVSFALVALLLVLALRSGRLIAAILLTLGAGLICTAAFAVVAFGSLNLISVAFAVLFIGLGDDFSIQVAVRFRDEHFRVRDRAEALRRCAGGISGPLLLAAATTMVGFLSFVPTAFQGVSELGVIAGVGMVIAVLLNLTLLPALLTLVRPPAEKEPAGYPWMAGPDRFLARHARSVLAVVLGLAALSAVLTAWLQFDFNPLNLKNKRTESVSTMLELLEDPSTTSYTAKILTASADAAAALAERLAKLPEVERVVTINSFVPDDQEEKLFIIGDALFLLEPTLAPPEVAAPPDDAAIRAALGRTAEGLRRVSSDGTAASAAARRLADALDRAQAADAATLARLAQALVGGIESELRALGEALRAQPVTLADIPPELARDWVAADGRAVIEVVPKGDARDNDVLRHFARTLLDIVPEASGLPIVVQQSGQTVVDAFRTAGLSALIAIAALLIVILRRPLDVLLVLAPPVLGGLFTMATWVLAGLQINFANIIVLPLMLGIGVAEGVYYVMNWRAGETAPLRSSMTRAVLFSTLTTGTAFGSLAMSSHPGTAGMGLLLTVSLAYTLLSSLVFLPAVFAWLSARRGARQGG